MRRGYVQTALVAIMLPFFGLGHHAMAEDTKVLSLASDPYCPYACDVGSPNPGFMVEFASEALAPLGYKVSYVVMPWKRVLAMAERGSIDGAITVDRDDGRDMVLPKYPIARSCQAFIVLKGIPFVWEGSRSIGSRKVAVISGYTYGGPISDWLNDSANKPLIREVSGETPLVSSLMMIDKGRADATVADCNVLAWATREIGMSDRFASHLTGVGVEMFIGINRSRKDAAAIVDAFDRSLEAMKSDGRLQRLAQKYSISNWQ